MTHSHKTLSITRHVFSFVLCIALVSFAIAWQPLFLGALILGALFVYVLSFYLPIGFYIMIALSMMTEWKIYFANYHAILKDYPQLLAVNAPVVDFWVIILLLAYAVYFVRRWLQGNTDRLLAPGFYWYGLFLLSAVVSLLNLPLIEITAGAKYIVRFLVFLYIGYILLGVNICKNKQILTTGLRTLSFVGIAGAIMGLVSLGLGLWEVAGFTRAVPFAIFGWAPFGYQHILLAEVLTISLPIAFFFYVRAEHAEKKWWGIGTLLILAAAILTLSRAALLTIAVEVLLLLYIFREHIPWANLYQKYKGTVSALGVGLVVLLSYAAFFILTNPTVVSSSEARSYMTDISVHLFLEHPFIGQGAGSYVQRLSEVHVFRTEFGDALEAHGIIQKLISEQGMFGLITFGLFMAYILYRLIQRYQHDHFTLEARLFSLLGVFLVLSPLVFQLFNTQYYSSKMWIPIMLAMAQFTLYREERKHGKVFKGDLQRRVLADA